MYKKLYFWGFEPEKHTFDESDVKMRLITYSVEELADDKLLIKSEMGRQIIVHKSKIDELKKEGLFPTKKDATLYAINVNKKVIESSYKEIEELENILKGLKENE